MVSVAEVSWIPYLKLEAWMWQEAERSRIWAPRFAFYFGPAWFLNCRGSRIWPNRYALFG